MTALEPSAFALDVYYANGCTGDAALERHIAVCARCAAYLSTLNALAEEPRVFAMPSATLLRAARPRLSTRTLGMLSAASAVGGVLAWLSLASPNAPHYVASKGVPAVQAVIRSAGRTRIWDGRAALRAGDAIALRTACDHFAHLAVLVATTGAATPWSRVFDAACPSDDDPLPFSLVADDKSEVEHIHVIFSQQRLDDAGLRTAIERSEHTSTVWVSQLTFHKAGTKP